MRRLAVALTVALLAGVAASPARATWAVVLADSRTGEVGIGQATCVANIDLRSLSAVIVTGRGVATVQAQVDSSGVSRAAIRDGFLAGTAPAQILTTLAATDPAFQTHQYCMADVEHDAVTYTGTSAQGFDYAGGTTGQVGTLRYCVAGNLLAGAPVVAQAMQAVLDAPGSLADKLVAAMEAARSMGGDGRCSCSPSNPTGCGSPPASFTVSAINGYLVVARAGDTAQCSACSAGDYYLDLGVRFRPAGSPDPVTVLQGLYATFVADQQGRPDAVVSQALLTPPALLPDGVSTAQLDVQLLDLDGAPLAAPLAAFEVEQGVDSDAVTSIGAPVDLGGDAWASTITAGTTAGVDHFAVTADDGMRPVILMPEPRLPVGVPGEVLDLRWTASSTLEWSAAPAAVAYHVYRGDLALVGCAYLGECRDDLDPDPTDQVLVDAEVPASGFFYLLSAVDAAGSEGTLGPSACGVRVASDVCP